MKTVVTSAPLQPSHGCRQIRSEYQYPEVVGSQQLMGHRVVGGEVADPAFHQWSPRAYFVVKRPGSAPTFGWAINLPCKSPCRAPIAAPPRRNPCIASQCNLSFTGPP